MVFECNAKGVILERSTLPPSQDLGPGAIYRHCDATCDDEQFVKRIYYSPNTKKARDVPASQPFVKLGVDMTVLGIDKTILDGILDKLGSQDATILSQGATISRLESKVKELEDRKHARDEGGPSSSKDAQEEADERWSVTAAMQEMEARLEARMEEQMEKLEKSLKKGRKDDDQAGPGRR